MPALREIGKADSSFGYSTSLCAVAEGPPDTRSASERNFYRFMLGEFQVTALSDGVFELDTRSKLDGRRTRQIHALLEKSFLGEAVPTSVNAYLIDTGDRRVLVDAGAATLFGPSLGRLSENLVAAGYRSEQIDAVLITHMHPDHIGGLVVDDRRAFPNALVYADVREAEFWLDETLRAEADGDLKAAFEDVAITIGRYQAEGMFRTFAGPSDLFPGIRAVPAPGHTPGHTMYAVESSGRKLVLWGDLVEVGAVQFVEPDVTAVFDLDAQRSVEERQRWYADAAQGGYLIAGAHLSFPGVGRLRGDSNGYAWNPVEPSMSRSKA